jgi:ATP-dependent Clp protease ATP-binding subunit ClpX
MLPTPRELEAYLDRMVIGQKRAKRVLATSVYTHFLLAAARRDSSAFRQGSPGTGRAARQHVLLLGPTGSGKSLLVRTLAEFLGVPFVRADATRMTEAGLRRRGCDDAADALDQGRRGRSEEGRAGHHLRR